MITNNSPISSKAKFSDQCNSLPAIMRRRYAIDANNNDVINLEGNMNITFSLLMSLFMPFLKLLKTLIPFKGKNVKVDATFFGKANVNAIYIERIFYFTPQNPYIFSSHIEFLQNNEMIEYALSNIGVKMTYSIKENKIIFQHKSYVIKIYDRAIILPISFIIGKIYVEEIPLSDDSYQMLMKMTHPLLGVLYEYSGVFKMANALF